MSIKEDRCKSSDTSEDVNDWTTFSQWFQCICVVTFDLNLGQALEYVYPPQFQPTEQEISNICYMAFPDSNSGCMGDTKFHMRLRNVSSQSTKNKIIQKYKYYNSDCLPIIRAENSHYWGFVYFRQRRDPDLPRGYFQKSLIIITCLPFFNLFYELLPKIAAKYFDNGTSILEQCCLQIDREWPRLQTDVTLNLPLFDTNYQILIPKNGSRKIIPAAEALPTSNQRQDEASLSTKLIATVHELDLFTSLELFVENIYTLWELVLIAEPIVVIATSPEDCSHMVQALLALIAPLEYCAEARPYFTIHDSEFKEFTKVNDKSPQSLILGVTNPFFIKLLRNWPHMLRLVDKQIKMQQLKQKRSHSSNALPSLRNVAKSKFKRSTHFNTSSTGAVSSCDEYTPGLYTKYKPFLKKDNALIKKVLLGIKTKRPQQVQSALLRRNLLELTQSFMIPLERYIASLMPLQKDISPFKSAPDANSFKLDDFLATLELSGPHLTSPLKGDWKGLYKRFFHSPNFRGWYEARHRELQLTLQDLQLQALTETNLKDWARDKQEVEIIDMILKLRQKLNLYTDNFLADGEGVSNDKFCEKQNHIRTQINSMKELLPYDLKNLVNL